MSKKHISKLAVFCGLVGLFSSSVEYANAERIITDYEASRLTLSALIAPPSTYHARSARKNSARKVFQAKTNSKNVKNTKNSYVQNVAYHGHVVSPHKRNNHHRRG